MQVSKKIKQLLFVTILFANSFAVFSQDSKKTSNYSKHPHWIEMMNNPKANYFEITKAYTEFWASRKEPNGEDEVIGQSKKAEEKNSLLSRWFKSKEEKKEAESEKYALDVKKYKHWQLKILPYVQEDGSILDADARLKIWQEEKAKTN